MCARSRRYSGHEARTIELPGEPGGGCNIERTNSGASSASRQQRTLWSANPSLPPRREFSLASADCRPRLRASCEIERIRSLPNADHSLGQSGRAAATRRSGADTSSLINARNGSKADTRSNVSLTSERPFRPKRLLRPSSRLPARAQRRMARLRGVARSITP